eukprot:scaffold268795_cov22-Tisochrysis_lutea.AAC.1
MFFTEPAAAGAALARAEPLKAGDGATAGAPDAAGVGRGCPRRHPGGSACARCGARRDGR